MIDEIYRFKLASEFQRRRTEKLRLGGSTWPLREQIRDAGGLWDSMYECWLMPSLETIHQFSKEFDEERQMYIVRKKKGKKDDR